MDHRSASSNHADNTVDIPQPHSQHKLQNSLRSSLRLAVRAKIPQQCGVRSVLFGDIQRYPGGGQRLKLEKAAAIPTLQIMTRNGSVHVELHGVKRGSGRHSKPVKLASFHFVEDGEYMMSVRVYRIRQQVDFYKYNVRKGGKQQCTQFWTMRLGDDNDTSMKQTKAFWDTLCHELQKLSFAQCRYLNLQRQARPSISAPLHEHKTRYREQMLEAVARLPSAGMQEVLVIPIPRMKKDMTFTGALADPAIMTIRDRMMRGGHVLQERPNVVMRRSVATAVQVSVRQTRRQKHAAKGSVRKTRRANAEETGMIIADEE